MRYQAADNKSKGAITADVARYVTDYYMKETATKAVCISFL